MFFGLDISDHKLRLVQLKKSGKKININFFNEIEIPAGIICRGEIIKEREADLINLFKKLIRSSNGFKTSTKNLVTVLPESKTFIKNINIKNIKGNDNSLLKLINEEIKNHIPFSPDEIYLDWQIIVEKSDSSKVLVGAVLKSISDSYLEIMEKSGLNPYVFEIEATAITRSLLKEKEAGGKIIIDFGAARTSLIVYGENTIQFTVSLPISGNDITETITKSLKIDIKEAEKAKIVCGLEKDRCEGALVKILTEPIEKLVREIKKAINFYQINFPDGEKISEIILCGGGANFLGIEKVISEKTKIKTHIGDPLINITKNKKNIIPNDEIISYTTAIGLALRSLKENYL